ncbi:MAG: histidine kinase [Saprospiraceae bacterium]|nr:MAG: histidine kinase [Saprospiraceae bacterium]
MKILPKDSTFLLEKLKSFEAFAEIKNTALEWLIDKSRYVLFKAGTNIFEPDMAADYMQVIIKGRFSFSIEQKGEIRELGVWESGFVTGVLPFSRMKITHGFGKAIEDCYLLELHRDCFTEMVNTSYALTQNLVGLMSNRIRDFSQMRSQNEKLMSLGKLSAGLAHELNNPASAMVRSADELYQKIHTTPEKFKNIITMRITSAQTDVINDTILAKIRYKKNKPELSLMDREELFDELTDWLEDHAIDNGDDIADTFADFGLTPDELDEIDQIVGKETIPPLMWWIESTLSLENIVTEIKESAKRIANLVKSIKEYSHMDRGVSLEAINVHDGLRSTVIMLKHKINTKQIKIQKNLCETLPKIKAYPGELNQVWTNLIVNALDAMSEGGTLTIDTYTDREYVCVAITDSGTGISEENLTQIFDPFFTTKSFGEGTGMGLDIVKKIIDRHNADIKVESKPGKTTFKLCFPAAD